MLTYPSELLVVSRSSGYIRYARFDRGNKLELSEAGCLSRRAVSSDLFNDTRSGLLLYVVSPEEYSQKQVDFASRFRFDSDPDQICWEIGRRSVAAIHRFRYNLLPLRGRNGSESLLTFAVSDKQQEEIGHFFAPTRLVLHRLIFKPVALYTALRREVTQDQSVIVVVARDQISLLFYQNRQLADFRTLGGDLLTDNGRARFVDDLGTVAASVFSGVRLNQKLELVVAGVAGDALLFERLAAHLPYRLEISRLSVFDVTDYPDRKSIDNPEEFFDLAVIARSFAESEPCESLPVKNADSP